MFIGNETIDLRLTLVDSAQCFRWTQSGERFGAVIDGEPVWLEKSGSGLHAEGGDAARLRDYLDLNRDYGALAGEFASIPVIRRAVEMYPGLRVLNQNPWDALVSFILSANNHVGRIRKLCDALAWHCGDVFETRWGTLCGFPAPERLAQCEEPELRALGVGYRAPYLIRTARAVADGFPLDALCEMDYAQAHAKLTELAGVGDKVADCVLLFGCRHASAFPVDTWVEKLVRSWLGIDAKGSKGLMNAARSLLGAHAGLAQQFLFHAARTGGIALEEAEPERVPLRKMASE